MSGPAAGTEPSISPAHGRQLPSAYEQVFVPHVGDAVRLMAFVAIPAAWLVSGPLSALTMLLVSGGTWVLRYYSRTRGEDLAGQVVLFLGGAFSVLGTYRVIGWLDVVVHLLVLAVLTTALINMFLHHGMLPAAATRRQAAGLLVSVAAMGVGLAVLWEIGEWFGHTFINPEVGVGYADTLGDLVAGSLGALLAALWFHGSPARGRQS